MKKSIRKILDKYKLSEKVEQYLIERSDFQECCKNVKNGLMDYDTACKIKTLIEFVQGNCPRCNGRMNYRSGYEFDNELRCIVCGYID